MFGPHLTLDLYGCNEKRLSSSEAITKLLSALPGLLSMRKFSDPKVFHIPSQSDTSFDRGGVTGFVILIESHMTVHTFPADGFVSFDIFSCKSFNKNYAVKLLKKWFGAERVETNFMRRGKRFVKHYPRVEGKAEEIARKERVTVCEFC